MGILWTSWKNQWDKAYRFTAVINSDPLYVISVNPVYHELVILKVPSDVYLNVPYGYGNYLAGNVFALGTLDSKRSGGYLLRKSIENTFAIVTEGYLAKKTGKPEIRLNNKDDIRKIKSKFFSFVGVITSFPEFIAYFSDLETNLSFMDKFNLWNAIRSTRLDNIIILDIDEASVFSKEKLPDGTFIKIIDPELFDAFISFKFQDQLVRSEKVSLEIINAAEKDRLASLFGRILNNLGANVVAKDTSEESKDFICLIRLSEKKKVKSHIVKRLKALYHCEIDSEISEKNIADVEVILGKQFLK